MVQITESLITQLEATTVVMRRELARGEKEVAQFENRTNRRLARIDRRFDRLGKSISRALSPRRLALSTTAIAGALAVGVRAAIQFADEIGKTADRIGISTDALQEYRLAGELAGVEVAQLDKGLEQLTKRLGESAAGTGALTEFLKRSDQAFLEQLQAVESTDQALELIIEQLTKYESAADRAALANAAFGRSGIALTNIARDEAAALRQAREAAERYGLIISEELIRKSEAANDQLTLVTRALQVNLTKALVQASPLLLELGAQFAELAPKIGDFFAKFAGLEFASLDLLEEKLAANRKEIERLRQASEVPILGPLADELAKAAEATLGAGATEFIFGRGVTVESLEAENAAIEAQIERRKALFAALRQAAQGGAGGAPAGAPDQRAENTLAALQREREALGTTAAQQAVLNNLRQAGLTITAEQVDAEGRLTVELGKEAEDIAELTREILARRDAQAELAEDLAEYERLEADVQSIMESVRTEQERRIETERKLQQAVAEGIITNEQRLETEERLRAQQEEQTEKRVRDFQLEETAARQAVRGIQAALQSTEKSWQDYAAIALDVLAQITAAAFRASQASAQVTPGGAGAGAASSGLFGLGFLGLQGGGTVRGGTPGRDSVPTLLTPDEEVIRAPAARRFRPLLKKINRMADGGTVGGGGNLALMGGEQNIALNLNIDARGADQSTVGAIRSVVQQEVMAFANRVNRGGSTPNQRTRSMGSALRRQFDADGF